MRAGRKLPASSDRNCPDDDVAATNAFDNLKSPKTRLLLRPRTTPKTHSQCIAFQQKSTQQETRVSDLTSRR